MVTFLKNWALSIVTLVLFLLMVEIMMPSGNTKKFINLVAGFILLLAIIRPIAEVFMYDTKINETFYIDSTFLDRNQIISRSRKLEEEQRTQVLNLYRERLIKRIEQAVLEVDGIKNVKVDLIINDDYESGKFGEVKRVYLELMNGVTGDKSEIKVEKILVGNSKQTMDKGISSGIIDKIKQMVGRITNVDEDDVVVSMIESQGGE